MKIKNSNLKIESNKDSILFKFSDTDFRKLYIRNFHGSYKLVMGAPKGYLIIQSKPQMNSHGNYLVIDVGMGFYNIEIQCFSEEEFKSRAEEIVNAVKVLCATYAQMKSSENKLRENRAHYDKSHKLNKLDFGKITLPEMVESQIWDNIATIYPKELNEYIVDIISLFDSKSIIINDNGRISFNKDFVEAVEALRSKLHSKTKEN